MTASRESSLSKTANHDRLVSKILIELSKTGLCKVWQQPTGAAYRGTQLIRYGIVGSADISGIMNTGIRLEVEVKTGAAVQSQGQKNFERMIISMGGHYLVARSVDDALTFVKMVAASTVAPAS